MSYTRSITGSVQWHTSGSVSYPASEHGGSVSYSDSGTVPVTINVHVDTTPFDASVATCNGSLLGLTGSVVAMNSAQCDAIQDSSKAISSHISGGFFSLIKSELSQNMAALFSKLNSGIMLVMEKTKLAKKQHEIMQNDYNRTLSRYVKVFSELDEECRRRILELDRSAYNLSEKVLKEQVSSMQTKFSMDVLTYSNDESVVNSRLLSACTKNKVGVVIENIGRNISQQMVYSKKMQKILRDAPFAGAKNASGDGAVGANGVAGVKNENAFFIPVLYTESLDFEAKTKKNENCYVADRLNNRDVETSKNISNFVQEYFVENKNLWKEQSKSEKENVKKVLSSLSENYLSESSDSDKNYRKRVYDVMMTLSSQEIKTC